MSREDTEKTRMDLGSNVASLSLSTEFGGVSGRYYCLTENRYSEGSVDKGDITAGDFAGEEYPGTRGDFIEEKLGEADWLAFVPLTPTVATELGKLGLKRRKGSNTSIQNMCVTFYTK